MQIKNIGFIGLGAMGLPMAKNLISAGFTLHASCHSNRAPLEELCLAGAIEEKSFADIAAASDVIITILPTDKEVRDMLLDPVFFAAIKENCVIIEMTSGTAKMVKEIADAYKKKNVSVFDAPVSGGVKGAQDGQLIIFGAGEDEVLERISPVLKPLAKKIYNVGKIGAGKTLKSINQVIASTNMLVISEAFSIAKENDINCDIAYDVISQSSGGSYIFNNKFKMLCTGQFEPSFKLSLMRKDIKAALEAGNDLNLPFTRMAYDYYVKASEKGYDNLDFAAVSKLITD